MPAFSGVWGNRFVRFQPPKVEPMPQDQFTPERQKHYIEVGKRAAAGVSRDEQVIGEAADHAAV